MSAFADENGAENEELSRPRGDGPWNGESSSSDDDGDLLILADGRKEEGNVCSLRATRALSGPNSNFLRRAATRRFCFRLTPFPPSVDVLTGDALWDDWYADEDEQERYRCLFCSLDFTEIPPLLDHCTDQHGFDYRKVGDGARTVGGALRGSERERKSLETPGGGLGAAQPCTGRAKWKKNTVLMYTLLLGVALGFEYFLQDLDFYGTIKLINYIRRKVRDEPASLTRLSDADLDEMTCLGDEFLIPVMEDDALLRGKRDPWNAAFCGNSVFGLVDRLPAHLDDADDENTNAEATAIAGPTPISGSDKNIAELEKQLCQSQRELSCVMDQFELYRKFVRENFL
ncbi:MAG: LOW QUALITY PROTEIN: hypothetical protein BJ554DRAFT_6587 [Olpidium bornovanus]|uniref:type I protein arginine methyltransferase n=1 Tax=Olpidium bornovanus TaxID=278681 RepID=A0A8H7ZXP7_9FUNG|nr:MAG: LOW QUALITY PROTEIN: hypothetical protein BJ554DRAFT_6587 [Olpidium bornovanus]